MQHVYALPESHQPRLLHIKLLARSAQLSSISHLKGRFSSTNLRVYTVIDADFQFIGAFLSPEEEICRRLLVT